MPDRFELMQLVEHAHAKFVGRGRAFESVLLKQLSAFDYALVQSLRSCLQEFQQTLFQIVRLSRVQDVKVA